LLQASHSQLLLATHPLPAGIHTCILQTQQQKHTLKFPVINLKAFDCGPILAWRIKQMGSGCALQH
jgi:hypothetical protein